MRKGAMETVSIAEMEPPAKQRRTKDPDALLVATAVPGLLKSLPTPMACGDEALAAINTKLKLILMEAAARATGNGRKTLQVCDL